jgi:YidC/Oxa1 family membrane protein insertase
MFLQMPIWIALYSGLSSTFELRQAPFLYGFTWINDLSKPDHLVQFSQPFNFLFLHIDGLNVIPFLLAGAFFMQQKLTPKPVATTPEQEQQQKMMQWMTLLFPVMLYGSPSGLNLYILTSTIFGIIESKIIRKHIKEREDREGGGGVTFVDGEIVDRDKDTKKKVEPKTGGAMGWFQRLQERAEQIRNEAEKKARDKRK